jgi:hypothetical protein
MKHSEQYENTNTNTNDKYIINVPPKNDDIPLKINKKNIIKMPRKKCIVKQKTNIITKNEIVDGHMEICPKDAQSIKQFNKDFFNFRDKTHNNTSIMYDTVDKITDLTLNSGWWTPPVGEEVAKISDIYDKLTQRPDFQSACTRIPTFDSVMYDGYEPKHVTGLYSNGNEWVYDKELSINGGQLEKKLYPNDPDFAGDQYPLSAFPPIEPTSWSG